MALAAGWRLGPYEIVDRLGAGGMGEVYRARDTRLGREVAVKILPAAHARDIESVRRFEKEARAVASLAHPHVVPLFDVGEEGELRYAVTELVSGETLRARMAGGPLPTTESAQIAAGVAEGLAAAHAKGIVHRDIKPENIMLTGAGFARILDFGLAKTSQPAVSATESEEERTQSALVTEAGVVAGTVGYMSPEQVRGEAVDGRSDVFSLGVVLWEMLSGNSPFRGSSHVEILHAILKEEPRPEEWAALPPELVEIVRRCLEKHPDHRYHSAADLAHDLRKVAAGREPFSAAIPRSAASEQPPTRAAPKWRNAILFGALGLIVVGLVVFLSTERQRPAAQAGSLPRTIAVLPFRPIRGAGMPEGFGLGLADSLIGHLSAVRELTVRPTSAISRYETEPIDATDVGRRLGVEAVLEGTYQRVEGMTRVSVQMTDLGRGAILWSERIDLPEGRLFELQDTISRQVVERLRGELEPEEKRALGRTRRISDHAMEQYLAARARLFDVRAWDVETRRAIAASFDGVLAEEPDFAPALGARAYARAALAFREPTRENYEAALSDANRATALDADVVEARLARTLVTWSPHGGWDVVKAVRELKEAIAKSPGLDIARADLALVYWHSGWFSEAEAEVGALERIDPSAIEATLLRRDILARQGRYREALEQYRRLPDGYRRSWGVRAGTAFLLLVLEGPRRAEPQIERLLEGSPDRAPYLTIMAILRAQSGRRFDDLEREILTGKARGAGHFHHHQHGLAEAHAAAGDVGGAVELLRKAAENGFPCARCFDNDTLLAPIRDSPEYAALKAEIEKRNAGYRAALKDVL